MNDSHVTPGGNFAPVRLRQTPSQREAVRIAMGASPRHEAATAWALTAAVVVTCFVVLGIAVSGC